MSRTRPKDAQKQGYKRMNITNSEDDDVVFLREIKSHPNSKRASVLVMHPSVGSPSPTQQVDHEGIDTPNNIFSSSAPCSSSCSTWDLECGSSPLSTSDSSGPYCEGKSEIKETMENCEMSNGCENDEDWLGFRGEEIWNTFLSLNDLNKMDLSWADDLETTLELELEYDF